MGIIELKNQARYVKIDSKQSSSDTIKTWIDIAIEKIKKVKRHKVLDIRRYFKS